MVIHIHPCFKRVFQLFQIVYQSIIHSNFIVPSSAFSDIYFLLLFLSVHGVLCL